MVIISENKMSLENNYQIHVVLSVNSIIIRWSNQLLTALYVYYSMKTISSFNINQ